MQYAPRSINPSTPIIFPVVIPLQAIPSWHAVAAVACSAENAAVRSLTLDETSLLGRMNTNPTD